MCAFAFDHYSCEQFPRWDLRRPSHPSGALPILYLSTATEYNRLEQTASLVVSDFFPSKRLAGPGTG